MTDKEKSEKWLERLKQIADNIKSGPATIHYTDEMLMEFSKIEKDKDRFRVTSDVLNQTFDYRAD